MKSALKALHLLKFLTVVALYNLTYSAEAITYRMAPQPASKPGWSFDGGFITTDGTLGEIGPQNFVDWSIKFTSPFGTHALCKDNGFATLVIESFVTDFGDYGPAGDALALVATEQWLGIPPVVRSSRISVVNFTFSGDIYNDSPNFPMLGVTFGRSSPASYLVANLVDDDNEYDYTPSGFPLVLRQSRMATFKFSNDDIIAITVPEPSFVALGVAALSVTAMRRHPIRI